MKAIEERIKTQLRRIASDADIEIIKQKDGTYLAQLNDFAFYAEYNVEVVDNHFILRYVMMEEYKDVYVDGKDIRNEKLVDYISEIKRIQEKNVV